MFNRFIKFVLFLSLLLSAPTYQNAGLRDMYHSAKERYNKLSGLQKAALGVGVTAVITGALYYALQRNDRKFYRYLVKKYHNLPTWKTIKSNAKELSLADKARRTLNQIHGYLGSVEYKWASEYEKAAQQLPVLETKLRRARITNELPLIEELEDQIDALKKIMKTTPNWAIEMKKRFDEQARKLGIWDYERTLRGY